MAYSFTLLPAATLAAVYISHLLWRKFSRPPLPPGPRGIPILGNIHDVPAESPWLALAALGERYAGGLFSLQILGQPMIVVDRADTAADLLDTHGAALSGRPTFAMAGALVGYDGALPLCQYGPRVRTERVTRIDDILNCI
ncbi:unnamed protein product [Mycena citricolor]|uniref:Cytochrome P450 n=1 Tax=Mycena citricolor TaxID=2018698 RepID=A0AAD2HE75_9AGAR|nr:unnamed protein product [Mycena citricolor]